MENENDAPTVCFVKVNVNAIVSSTKWSACWYFSGEIVLSVILRCARTKAYRYSFTLTHYKSKWTHEHSLKTLVKTIDHTFKIFLLLSVLITGCVMQCVCTILLRSCTANIQRHSEYLIMIGNNLLFLSIHITCSSS